MKVVEVLLDLNDMERKNYFPSNVGLIKSNQIKPS